MGLCGSGLSRWVGQRYRWMEVLSGWGYMGLGGAGGRRWFPSQA